MVNEEEIEILYNSIFGGWRISKKAFELYKLRSNLTNLSEFEKDFCCRDDQILIQIYKELGDNFDDKFSKSKIKKIQKKYENYYYIEEYDGKEYVKIDYTKYKLDNIYNKIKKILQSNIDNSIKINEIEEFISGFEM
jgi:hypothetical protein